MILFPSTPLLIHILAVLCFSYRLVLSEDTDLFDAVVANDEVAGGSVTNSTDDPTTMESSTTDYSTTDTDMNTTESMMWTSSTAGTLPCVPSTKADSPSVCVLEGTEDQCDPCEGIDCGTDKRCVANKSTCKSSDNQCECTDDLTYNKDGVCTNPCLPNPCSNAQPCVPTTTNNIKFRCDCSSDYDGLLCDKVHDYCKDEHPADCPLGARECTFQGVGKYSCGCVEGYILDNSTNTCMKVTQRMSVNLKFNTLYMEAYNVDGTPERAKAINSIDAAMADLYGDLLIPPISYSNFTQGSLIAHYSMNMRMAKNGDPEQNVDDLMIYITNCATKNKLEKTCFDDLGIPFLPENGVVSEDLRCDDVYCPVGTHCEAIEKSDKSIRCACDDGYSLNRTVVEDTGRQIDICDDINECELDPPPCKGTELCNNTPGSFECLGSPCDKNPCPGNAECKAVDQFTYDCHCSWIYVASDCGTPWMLILVIVSSVLLALLILAIIGLIILFSRSKSGSSVLEATSF